MRRVLQRFLQRNSQLQRHHLRQPVYFHVRNLHRAAHIFNRRLRRHSSKRDDLRHVLASVFLRDVINQLASPPHAEININIRHRNSFRIQEPFEQQIVLQWINVGNPQRITDQASRRRSSSRTNRNILRPRILDKIPHDQKISFITHFLNHLDFAGQSPLVFRQRIRQCSSLGHALQIWHARREPFPHHFFEITSCGVSGRNLEFRKWIWNPFNLHVAACRNIHRSPQRLGNFAKHFRHLRGGLEIELVGRELHPVRVTHGLASLNAQQYFLRVRVFVVQVMAIVGRHQRNSRLLRKPHQMWINIFLDFQPLILNLQEKTLLSENVSQSVRVFPRQIVFFIDYRLGHRTFKACG